MHQDDVEDLGHHTTFDSWQLLEPSIALSLKKLRDVSFVNPLAGKDNDISSGVSNPKKHHDPVWINKQTDTIDLCLEGEVSEVRVMDVGVEDAYNFLLHPPFDDGKLHPPIIWNCRAYSEVINGRLLYVSLNEDLLL